jgi:hypothetical protein
VWPRSERLPRIALPGQTKPVVTVTVGKPFKVTAKDPDVATKSIMKKIVALLPAEARVAHAPTAAELAKTYPAGYKGDPNEEIDRRPGTDS